LDEPNPKGLRHPGSCHRVKGAPPADFFIKEVTDTAQRDELNGYMKRDRPEFVQTDERVWMAAFKIDGVQRVAAIRVGHDHNVADDMIQQDIHLRVNEVEFDNDEFIPEASAAEILALVSKEVEKQFQS
jgi:hypothetical protein